MTRLTDGKVAFTRRSNTGNYEYDEAKVELSFAVEDDVPPAAAADFLDKVGELAVAKVEEILSLKKIAKPTLSSTSTLTTTGSISGAGSVATVTGAGATAATPAKTKVSKPPTAAASTVTGAASASTVTGAASTVTGAAHDPFAENVQDGFVTGEAARAPELQHGADEWTAASTPIADNDLLSEVTKINCKYGGKASLSIRALIGKYVAPPKGLRDIPAEKREAFLKELAALPAPAG